jgi:hypothetical protein
LSQLLLCFPRRICSDGAGELFSGDITAQKARADGLVDFALNRVGKDPLYSGGTLFDSEWAFGTCQMTVMGMGQIIETHPVMAEDYLPAMEA